MRPSIIMCIIILNLGACKIGKICSFEAHLEMFPRKLCGCHTNKIQSQMGLIVDTSGKINREKQPYSAKLENR